MASSEQIEKASRAADFALGGIRKGAKSAVLNARAHVERMKESGAGSLQIDFATAVLARAEALWELVRFE